MSYNSKRNLPVKDSSMLPKPGREGRRDEGWEGQVDSLGSDQGLIKK